DRRLKAKRKGRARVKSLLDQPFQLQINVCIALYHFSKAKTPFPFKRKSQQHLISSEAPPRSLCSFCSAGSHSHRIKTCKNTELWVEFCSYWCSLSLSNVIWHYSVRMNMVNFAAGYLKMILELGFRGGKGVKGQEVKIRVAFVVFVSIWISLAGLYALLKPISNGCVMTYMYPTYIPISTPENVSSANLMVSLSFSYLAMVEAISRQASLLAVFNSFFSHILVLDSLVRSLGAESDRAYQGGPLEWVSYQASPIFSEEVDIDYSDIKLPSRYASMLDWFAVDLEGEHSAMDGQILQEHAEYVVYAIHRDDDVVFSFLNTSPWGFMKVCIQYGIAILDHYKESRDARANESSSVSGSVPKSVILVGHSMGGFIARAAVVHPHLRKFAVETVLTLSSPHQSPPVALQPSLGHYYAHVNEAWRKGYEGQTSRSGHYLSTPLLSHVVIVSISGGYNDYQVRTKLESLDGIVPSAHGFMISSTAMRNVWLSMEHQVILWCNQLVVQVSHTLLSLMDTKTGQPFGDVRQRVGIFTKMLHSGIPQTFLSSRQSPQSQKSDQASDQNRIVNAEWSVLLELASSPFGYKLNNPNRIVTWILSSSYGVNNRRISDNSGLQVPYISGCPRDSQWNDDGLERDLYIQTSSVTVLAMDGRRRWMDIHKLGADRKTHFVFVTNLSPCSGVRLHLWREKGTSTADLLTDKRVVEITSKMVHIPSGPAPRQIEPGSQTEQAPPSAVFWLSPQDMHGFRFLTILVAPRPTVSGRPPPAASMGVGQFFNPKDGEHLFSAYQLIHSLYSKKDVNLKEDHPLILNHTFSVSLGLLPISLTLETTGCGIKKSEFPLEESGDVETSTICRRRCFPPVALAWDATSGLHVFPNLFSERIIVDSSPALWTSSKKSDKTTVLLLVDPHCSYKSTVSISTTTAAGRFLILYFSQISGLCFAVAFFALMRQAYAWELDQPIPSLLSAVESNLRMPWPFFLLATLPVLLAVLISFLGSQPIPPIISFLAVSVLCYVFANGAVAVLILVSLLLFYVAGTVQVFFRKRWHLCEGNLCFSFVQWFMNKSSSFASTKVIRVLRAKPLLITSMIAIALVCLVHPALGLFVLLLSHAFSCHSALFRLLMASFRSHVRAKELYESRHSGPMLQSPKYDGDISEPILGNETCTGSPESNRSYVDTQLDIFHHQHGLLVLHLLAALMFVPSLVAWLQRIGIGQSFPWFWDSLLCAGVVVHGVCDSKPEFNFYLFPIPLWEVRLSFAYLLAGYFSYLSALALSPYLVFYAMAAIGIVSFIFRILQNRNRSKGDTYYRRSRKHSHRH
ncbi:GPI inositol-deacylase PGAP1-like protein, partial [Striga asiatica]